MDSIKPATIKDFQVKEVYIDELLFEFSFTAPGDDGDVGKAAYYEIKLMNNPETLIYDANPTYKIPTNYVIQQAKEYKFEIKHSTFKNLQPNAPGTPELFKIKLLDRNYDDILLAVKIRAIDKSGNQGEWSQVKSIRLDKMYKLANGIRLYEKITRSKAVSIKANEINREKMLMIFLISLFSTLLLIFIIVVTLICYRMREKKPDEKSETENQLLDDPYPTVRI